MLEGNINVIRIWLWLKVRYESAAKLEPLKRLCRENIIFLRLKVGGLLFEYIDFF